jgi:flavin reductase (DIM6/NTAB) family NADH-FMN oxidoreductase RutF
MKISLGAVNGLYPMPTTLVGALVDGKPNYIAIAHVGIMGATAISLSMNKSHYTNAGIKQQGTFSVNIPAAAMVAETDYCGIVSGRNEDKSRLFDTFFGKLGSAPMISQCPLNMECRLVQTVDFPRHDVFIGEIVETYADERILTDKMVDLAKLQPVLFSMHDRSYWRLGERLAKAWEIGKTLIKK